MFYDYMSIIIHRFFHQREKLRTKVVDFISFQRQARKPGSFSPCPHNMLGVGAILGKIGGRHTPHLIPSEILCI